MKICPRCQKKYTDDELNFCLDDGANLARINTLDNSPPATLLLNQTRPNEPQQFHGEQSGNPNNWNSSKQVATTPPPKKSKTWLWAIGIIGGLILLCGGGLTGFIFYAATLESNNQNANYQYSNNTPRKSPSPAFNTTAQEIDLSKWADGDTDLGATEYKNGELLMSSKKKNYYYVLVASAVYQSEDAVTQVTVRNVNEDASSLGFGLVIHSNPVPLKQDYAFLIDSVSKRYRVVQHSPGKETTLVGWTRLSTIKDGSEPNVLEVRDQNKKMNFYINGEFVKAFDNTDGYDNGVAGIYSGDAVEIAFSNLEIKK